jgi:hypothetical protein
MEDREEKERELIENISISFLEKDPIQIVKDYLSIVEYYENNIDQISGYFMDQMLFSTDNLCKLLRKLVFKNLILERNRRINERRALNENHG